MNWGFLFPLILATKLVITQRKILSTKLTIGENFWYSKKIGSYLGGITDRNMVENQNYNNSFLDERYCFKGKGE